MVLRRAGSPGPRLPDLPVRLRCFHQLERRPLTHLCELRTALERAGKLVMGDEVVIDLIESGEWLLVPRGCEGP